jgi:hypothetical protein
MKALLTLTLISVAALHAAFPSAPVPETVTVVQSVGDKELTWVDEQIQAILPARVGVSEGIVGSLLDPMKMKKIVPVASSGNLLAPPKLGSTGILALPKIIEEPLRLQALINKSALINGQWYKLNDPVRTFTLSEIKPNSVLLLGKKEQKILLFLTKQNSNIKITTK